MNWTARDRLVLVARTAADVQTACRQAGFLVNAVQPDAIRLAPPLILQAGQAEEFLAAWPAILDQAAGAASGGAAPGPPGRPA